MFFTTNSQKNQALGSFFKVMGSHKLFVLENLGKLSSVKLKVHTFTDFLSVFQSINLHRKNA